jgi:ubiquinone/menaquinone biosynthesis C-methylase UbiE
MQTDTPLLYNHLAQYYDSLFWWKDYEKESRMLKRLIDRHKISKGRRLLDVACGTGSHLFYLQNEFCCTGIDQSKEMLAISSKKVSNATFKQGEMSSFKLPRKFDVLLCLFNSINYAKTFSKLEKTIENFTRHIFLGGVAIIEPWLSDTTFKDGAVHSIFYNKPECKIASVSITKKKKLYFTNEIHYLIGESERNVRYFKENHRMCLIEFKDLYKSLECYFDVHYYQRGISRNPLFVCIKRDRNL